MVVLFFWVALGHIRQRKLGPYNDFRKKNIKFEYDSKDAQF